MLKKLTSPFREFGCFAGLLYAVGRVLERLSPNLRLYFYELLVQPISEKPLLAPRLANTFEIREIRRGDPEVAVMPARPGIKESRFEQNAICLGAFRKGEFIGHIWLCFRSYEEDEVRCTFVLPEAEQAVFDFDLYLFSEHRMGLGFIGIWNGVNEFLRRRGIKFSFSRLTRFNLASRRAHKHLGTKRVGRAFFLKAWSVELMVATVSPYLHLSLAESKRVRIKLRPDVVLVNSSVPHG
jgi:hypothetical protein